MKRLIQILIVGALVVVLTILASAQVPQMINYQGKLTSASGAPVNDTLQMVFTIYSDSGGTNPLWTETQGAVVVEKGVFNVLLGSVNPISYSVFDGSTRYLGVKVGGDPEITPRKPMVSVAYAYRAGSGGGGGGGWIDDGTVVRLETSTDYVGIGTTSPNEQLEITGNLRLPATTATTGIIRVGAERFIHNYGTQNTFEGVDAGNLTMTGGYNTANGYQALYSNTTGSQNTANGLVALYSNTTGSDNTANGSGALYSNTTGSGNTANGLASLYSNTTGSQNTANGFKALTSNTTGVNNTANGYWALYSNTTGYTNTANGVNALFSNTTGYSNTANGVQALYSNTTGYTNTATGRQALNSNTTGYENTATGMQALYSNTTGDDNTANGNWALYSNTTGESNTANGEYALYYNTTGYWNTANGGGALYSNTTGHENTALGCGADVSSGSLSNATAIGFGAVVDADNKVRIGNTAVTSIGGQVGWTTFSDGRYKKSISENVPGLAFINKLKPVTYTMDVDAIDAVLRPPRQPGEGQSEEDLMPSAEEMASKQAQSQIVYTGFTGQEVEKAAQELGFNFSGVDAPKSENGMYGLRYAEFVVPLVKAVQEQQQMIQKQQEMIQNLQKRIEELEKR
jgi:hypothetical protein